MDQKGNLQSRLRKICAEIDELKNEEKKELSKIEEKTRRVNSFRRELANMLEQKYQVSVQGLKNNEDQVVDYEKMSQLFQLYYEANDEKFYRTLNLLDRESEKIQLEYKTKFRKKSEEMEDLQIEIHRLEDEGSNGNRVASNSSLGDSRKCLSKFNGRSSTIY